MPSRKIGVAVFAVALSAVLILVKPTPQILVLYTSGQSELVNAVIRAERLAFDQGDGTTRLRIVKVQVDGIDPFPDIQIDSTIAAVLVLVTDVRADPLSRRFAAMGTPVLTIGASNDERDFCVCGRGIGGTAESRTILAVKILHHAIQSMAPTNRMTLQEMLLKALGRGTFVVDGKTIRLTNGRN